MKFKELEIENFLTVGKISARLDDRGLVLICGENLDDSSQNSNGAGKSSIVDALSWALFGTTARGVTSDDVINDKEGKNCRVKVSIDSDGDIYTVTRHRKYAKHRNRLLLEGPSGDMTLGTDKLTQELVDKLVGATVEVFCASVYAGQENMPDLPGMGDRELKSIVEESAGIKDIEAGYRVARDRLNEKKKQLEENNRNIEFNNIRATELAADRKETLLNQAKWSVNLKERVTAAKQEVAKAKKVEQDHLAEVEASLKKLPEIKAKIEELGKSISSVSKEREELEMLQANANSLGSELKNIDSLIARLVDAITSVKKDREKVADKIGKPCGECGRDHDESTMGAADDSLKRILKEKLLKLQGYKNEKVAISEKLLKARESVEAFKLSMTDVSAQIERRDSFNKLAVTIERMNDRSEELNRIFKQKATDYVRIRDEVDPYASSLEIIEERIKANKTKGEDIAALVKTAEYNVRVAEEVAGVFSPAGVRAHILDNVTPYLNSRTSYYLSALSDGNITAVWNTLGTTAKGDIREKFNIDVESAKGGNSFRKLSGGEKRKVRLATAMALQDLVASRATKPINLFIADEVDAALDESGLERLMVLLREKAAEVGSVLVISHSDLKSWISNSITVVKEGGKARLEGEALS